MLARRVLLPVTNLLNKEISIPLFSFLFYATGTQLGPFFSNLLKLAKKKK
jgi:hypothetical protein